MKEIIIVFIIILLTLISCSDSTQIEPKTCVDKKVETFIEENTERGFTCIYTFEPDGKTYFIFDPGIAFDATAEIVDESCNVVCVYGGFRLASDQDKRCDAFQESINTAIQTWAGGK